MGALPKRLKMQARPDPAGELAIDQKTRRSITTLGVVVAVLLAAGALAWAAPAWWFRHSLTQAGHDYAAGRYDAALARLTALRQRSPDHSDVELLWGLCQRGAGHGCKGNVHLH